MRAAPTPGMLRIAICLLVASACSYTPRFADEGDLPGTKACESGAHACGSTCMPDQGNTPDIGCRQGCGEACPSGANSSATCTAEGICALTCNPGFADVGGACIPNACEQVGYTCGPFIDNGGASFDCGSCETGVACGNDHACAIGADNQEPNNSIAGAKDLGEFDDAADRMHRIPDLAIANADEDWFRFHIADGPDGGNPLAIVELSHETDPGWLTSNHELTVWFKCDSAESNTRVDCGEANTTFSSNTLNDPTLGLGCTLDARQVVWAEIRPSCSSTADGGIVTVRIRKLDAPRGDRYVMTTLVE